MAVSPFSNDSFRKAFLILWSIWFTLHIYTLYSIGIIWELAVKDSIYSLVIITLLCWLVSNLLAYYQPRGNKYIYIIIWCLALGIISSLIIYFTFPSLVSNTPSYLQFLKDALPIRFGFSFLLIGWMAMVSVLCYNQHEKEELEKRRTEAERLNKEAELTSLRERLQPHFLFNSLNSISALTFAKPAEARKMVNQLSDFLRGTIQKDDSLGLLKAELEHLQLYLDIEKVRFGHRLNTNIICNDDAANSLVPPMLLQPVVENAIKFGLYDTIEDVTIEINCLLDTGSLIISITNPYDPTTSLPDKGTGFGLASIGRRLQLIYNRKDLLQTSNDSNLFVTKIIIPQL